MDNSELGLPPAAAPTTITDIGSDLLCEIFLLLPSLPSLVRAARPSSTPSGRAPPSAAASRGSTRPKSSGSSSTAPPSRPSRPSASAPTRTSPPPSAAPISSSPTSRSRTAPTPAPGGGFRAWVWRAGADGVEKWMRGKFFPLYTLVVDTKDDARVYVEAVINGFAYLSVKYDEQPESLISLCLKTRKLNKLFDDTFTSPAHPYIMMWPTSLLCNKARRSRD